MGSWQSTQVDRYLRLIRRGLIDVVAIPLAFYVALLIRFEGQISEIHLSVLFQWLALLLPIYIGLNLAFGNYRRLWVYAGVREALFMAEAVGVSMLITLIVYFFWPLSRRLPFSVIILGGMLYFMFEGIIHFRREFLLKSLHLFNKHTIDHPEWIRVLILGVNHEARQLAHVLQSDVLGRYQVIGFLDDAEANLGMSIEGLPVLDEIWELSEIVSLHQIDLVVIAKRTKSQTEFQKILALCQNTNVQIKVLPNSLELISGHHVDPLDLREVTVQDLLDREPVEIDEQSCRRVIEGQIILVSGACGSIGSEICRQVSRMGPDLLVMIDTNESGLHDLTVELRTNFPSLKLKSILTNIVDSRKMGWAFETYKPAIVYHAAAYKHVPILEDYPDEAITTNIMGTVLISELANRHGVKRFIFVSTDKAVNPSSVMGATKRISELWIKSIQRTSNTAFSIVRFGNVIGSRGSVVPTFTRQIERGGPVTVTDPRMKRYFISIPEAVTLIIQTTVYPGDGNIFMLDMGDEVGIYDLAQRMIRLKGLRVNTDIAIEFTGHRPGEKLHEELSYSHECQDSTPHPRIFCLKSNEITIPKDLLFLTIMLMTDVARFPELRVGLVRSVLAVARGDIDTFLNWLSNIDFPKDAYFAEYHRNGHQVV